MSAMVLAINQTHFGGRSVVTCWTCHRGRSRPILTPTLAQVYGDKDFEPDDLVPVSPPDVPPPGPIVDRYLQAIGGVQKLASVQSFAATGTSQGFRGFGGGGRVQLYGRRPDQRSLIIEYAAAGRDATVRSFDGMNGWIRTPLNILGEYPLSGTELDGAKLDAQLAFPDQIKTALTRIRTLDPDQIDGKDVEVIQGNGPRNTFATLSFDKQSHLLVRMVRYGPSPIGRMPTQIEFGDYRDVGGIKMPFHLNFVWLDGRDAIQLDTIKLNAPVDASKFGRPTALESKR
jgi:hypothetical protein